MKMKNEADWKKWVDGNVSPYGRACVTYAERWADLMEKRTAEGAKLEDIAGPALCGVFRGVAADGFMVAAAVYMLAGCWEHGEALRRWNNLALQLGDEGERANESGGVVMIPVLPSIGTKD